MKGEFEAIYDECGSDGCNGPCSDPQGCFKQSPWSDSFKKVAFYGVIFIAVCLSLYVMTKDDVVEAAEENPMTAIVAQAEETPAAAEDQAVDFVYLFSEDEVENVSVLSQLDEAVEVLRNAGGGVRVHKFRPGHEYFNSVSFHYGLKTFPALLVLGPKCCNQFILTENFTAEGMMETYHLARQPSPSPLAAGKSPCSSPACN